MRAAFLATEETVSPLAELLLFAADRAQHVNFTLKPALDTGKIVISDDTPTRPPLIKARDAALTSERLIK
jgi:hypothetical protein